MPNLTDTAIRHAKPKAKPYKLSDTLGLFMLVQPSGARLWRFKYHWLGKEQKLSLGTYPGVSLAAARKRRDALRQQIVDGVNPALQRKRDKLLASISNANTFSLISAEYLEHRQRAGVGQWAPRTVKRNRYILGLLDKTLGPIPVAEIRPIDVRAALKKIETRGTLDTARKALELAGQVLRYGVATARLESDPTRDLRGSLVVPVVQHRAAIIEPSRVGELLRSIESYHGQGLTRIALQLLPHLFVRPGNLREAEWSEIDLEAAEWRIPAGKMKMRRDHREPLSRQVVELFRQAYAATGPTGYVFPSMRSRTRPISDGTFNAALRRLGYSKAEQTAHGFRTTASTMLNESGLFRGDVIEVASARVDSSTRGGYNHAAYWDERVEMAQWWSDRLDALRDGAEVIPLRARAA